MTPAGGTVGEPTFADRAFQAAAEAYLASPAGWEHAVQRALAELLAFLARDPHRTSACEIVSPGDPAALVRRDAIVDRFTKLLRPGYSIPPDPPPDLVAEAIGGSVLELIRAHVEERRVEQLPAALPHATRLVLTPFVGVKQAEELAASSKNVHADR